MERKIKKGSKYTHFQLMLFVQIENEFGSYGDVSTVEPDEQYIRHLLVKARNGLGKDLLLFTTDGGNLAAMKRGSLPGPDLYTVASGKERGGHRHKGRRHHFGPFTRLHRGKELM